MSIEYIIESFTHQNVPRLKGKPKCFFFQACRGRDKTRAADPPTTADADEMYEDSRFKHPEITKANILVVYATQMGTRSYVNWQCGSFFIDTLCQILQKQPKGVELISLLTKLNDAMLKTSTREKNKMHFPCDDSNYRIMLKRNKEGAAANVVMVGRIKPKSGQ